MKSLLCICLLLTMLLLSFSSQAQNNVSGKVVDVSGNAIDVATVALVGIKDSLEKHSGMTGADGSFIIRNIARGAYLIRVSRIGYVTVYARSVTLNDAPVITETIILPAEIRQLNTVDVASNRPVISSIPGGYSYNVERSAVSDARSIVDVLKQVPGVEVDNTGIKIRGNSSILVLVDGKRVHMSGQQLINYLRQFGKGEVATIDVNIVPTARYDAEGTGGILDLKLRKNTRDGILYRITAGVGSHDKYNAGISIDYKNKRISSTLGVRGNHSNLSAYDISTFLMTENKQLLTQDRTNKNSPGNGFNLRYSVDYAAAPLDIIGASFNYTPFDGSRPSVNTNTYESDGSMYGLSISDLYGSSHSSRFMYDLNYRRLNKKTKKNALLLDVNLITSRQAGNSKLHTMESIPFNNHFDHSFERNLSRNNTDVLTASTNYHYTAFKKWTAESGLKFTSSAVHNQFDHHELDEADKVLAAAGNNTTYNEQVAAFFSTFGRQFKKTTVQLGLRGEYTDIALKNETAGAYQRLSDDYFSLFPSLYVRRPVNESNELSFNASRRISRPKYQRLINYSSQYNSQQLEVRVGNLNLKPEFVYVFDVSHNYSFKADGSLNSSITYSRVTDPVQMVSLPDTQHVGRYLSMPVNLPGGHVIALNTSWSFDPVKNLTLSGGMGVRQIMLDANIYSGKEDRSGFTYNGNAAIAYNITKTSNARISCSYMSPQVSAQGENAYQFSVDASYQIVLSKKLVISADLSDIFNTLRFDSFSRTALYYSESKSKEESRIFTIGLSYRFGKSFKNAITEFKPGDGGRF